jgi:hypothetical protein
VWQEHLLSLGSICYGNFRYGDTAIKEPTPEVPNARSGIVGGSNALT